MNMRRLLLALAFFCLAATSVHAASRDQVVRRLEDFRRFFTDFQYAPDKAIPSDLLAECHGVIIMRQYKAGFVFGVKGGDGVIFLHDRATGEWSAPAFVVSGEGSFGLQIGGQSIDAIILIMNQSGVEMLLKTRFKIGVDASAAAGPVGRDASAQVGPGTALLAYSRSKGLYAGATFEGGALLNYDKFNRAMYGMDISIKDILLNRMVPIPPEAKPIIDTLRSYSVRSTVPQYQGETYSSYAQPMEQPGYGEPPIPTPTTATYPSEPVEQPQYTQPPQQYVEPPQYQEPQIQYNPQYDQQSAPPPAYYTPPPTPTPTYQHPPSPDYDALDRAAAEAAESARIAAEASAAASRAAADAAARAAQARDGR